MWGWFGAVWRWFEAGLGAESGWFGELLLAWFLGIIWGWFGVVWDSFWADLGQMGLVLGLVWAG